MIDWLLGNSTQTPNPFLSDPVQGNFDFHLQTSPSIPQTNSNLNILCYKNQTKRERLHVRVRWFRLKNGQLREIENVRGNTYNCEPSDLGAKIKAEISSLDQSVRGKAEVWFGPIKFDASLKQNISNILSKGKTRMGAGLYKEGRQAVSQITITNRELIFDVDKKTQSFEYSLSDPRIEVSSRDINKVWIRFNESSQQKLNHFLNINQVSIDISRSSRARQRKIYRTNFVNSDKLLEVKFNNRSARDTFIFTIKSFCAEREMKSSLILERLEKIDLNQEELCKQFFDYESLKSDVVRLDLLNQELTADRNQKILDLRNMELDVEETTRTYLKIINEKYKDKLDLNKSYSMISQKHDDIQEKRSITTLKDQNRLLRARLLDLQSEIEEFKSYNQEYNINPQMSPFFKKNLNNPEQEGSPNAIAQINIMNIRLAAENKKLKQKKERVNKNLLTCFQQSQTGKKDISRRSSKIAQLAHKMDLSIKEAKQKAEMGFEQSSILGNSMNSQAGVRLLENKFQQIKAINEKLLEQNQKLLQEIETYRKDGDQSSSNYKKQIQTLQKIYEVERQTSKREAERLRLEIQRISIGGPLPVQISHDNGQVLKLMEQLQAVSEQKEIVVRDIICLEGLYTDSVKEKERLQYIVLELQGQLNSNPEQLRAQNINLLSETALLRNQIIVLKSNNNDKYNPNTLELQNNINALVYQNQELFADLNFVRNQLQRCVQSLKQAEQDVAKLEYTVKSLKSQLIVKTKSEQKNIKKIKQLQSEIQLMKRSANALNRSRDLSADMSQYDGQMIEVLRKEMDSIIKQNENISEKCDSYAKQVRRLKQENEALKKATIIID